jgi:hypothetical protein
MVKNCCRDKKSLVLVFLLGVEVEHLLDAEGSVVGQCFVCFDIIVHLEIRFVLSDTFIARLSELRTYLTYRGDFV